MHDVAEVAGVSHQTVSRVLNGYEKIRPETRDRVLAAISQLGYRRNAAARVLATSRTHAIGVLAPAVSDYGPTSAVQALERAARLAGFHPLVTTTPTDRAAVFSSLGFLLDQGVEALVVIAPHIRVLDAVRELDVSIPVVTLQSTELASGTGISIDQLEGAQLAMAHLLELGHRRIQHLAGPLEFFEAAARRHGYEATLAEAGIEPLPLYVGDWTSESGYRAAASLAPEATAVFCGNDQMALGLIHGLADRGRRVPRRHQRRGLRRRAGGGALPPAADDGESGLRADRRARGRGASRADRRGRAHAGSGDRPGAHRAGIDVPASRVARTVRLPDGQRASGHGSVTDAPEARIPT